MSDQENLSLGFEEDLPLDDTPELDLDTGEDLDSLEVDSSPDDFIYSDEDITDDDIDLDDDFALPATALYDSGHDYITGMRGILTHLYNVYGVLSVKDVKGPEIIINYENYRSFMEQPIFAAYCAMIQDMFTKYSNNPLSVKEAYGMITQQLYVDLRWSPGIFADEFYTQFVKTYTKQQRKIASDKAKSQGDLRSLVSKSAVEQFINILEVNTSLFTMMNTMLSWIDEFQEQIEVVNKGTSRERIYTSPLCVPLSIMGPYFRNFMQTHPEACPANDENVAPKLRADKNAGITFKSFSAELRETMTSTERLNSWGIAPETAAAINPAEFLRRALNSELATVTLDLDELNAIDTTKEESKFEMLRLVSKAVSDRGSLGAPFLEAVAILISLEPVYKFVLSRTNGQVVPGDLVKYLHDYLCLRVSHPELCNPVYYASITYRAADDYILNIPCEGKMIQHESKSFLCSAVGNSRNVFVVPEFAVHSDSDFTGMILPPAVIVNALKNQFGNGTINTQVQVLYRYTLTPEALNSINISVDYSETLRKKTHDLSHAKSNTLIGVMFDYRCPFYDHLVEEADPQARRTVSLDREVTAETADTLSLMSLENSEVQQNGRLTALPFYYPIQWKFYGTDSIPEFDLRTSITKEGITEEGSKILSLFVQKVKMAPRSIFVNENGYGITYFDSYGGSREIMVPYSSVIDGETSFVFSDSKEAIEYFMAPAKSYHAEEVNAENVSEEISVESTRLPKITEFVGAYSNVQMPEHGLLLDTLAKYLCGRAGIEYADVLAKVRRRIAGDLQQLLQFTMLDQTLATQLLKTFKDWAAQPAENLDATNCEIFVELYNLVFNDNVKWGTKDAGAVIAGKIPEMMAKVEREAGVQAVDIEKLWSTIDIGLLPLHVLSKYDLSSEPNMQVYNALMYLPWCRLFLGCLESSMILYYVLQLMGEEAYYLFYRQKKLRTVFKFGVNALNFDSVVSDLCAIRGVPKCTLPTCRKVLVKNPMGSDTALKYAILRHNLHRVLNEIEELQNVSTYQELYAKIRKDLPNLPQFDWEPGTHYEKQMCKMTDDEFNDLVSKDEAYIIFNKYYAEFLEMVYRGTIIEALAVSDARIVVAYDLLLAYGPVLCKLDDAVTSTEEFKDDFYRYCGCFALCYSQLTGAALDAVGNGQSSIDAFRVDPSTIPAWSKYPALGKLDITDMRLL